MKAETVAKKIVKEIEFDISDRRGIGSEWEQVDDDIKSQIKKLWVNIALKNILKLDKGEVNHET